MSGTLDIRPSQVMAQEALCKAIALDRSIGAVRLRVGDDYMVVRYGDGQTVDVACSLADLARCVTWEDFCRVARDRTVAAMSLCDRVKSGRQLMGSW